MENNAFAKKMPLPLSRWKKRGCTQDYCAACLRNSVFRTCL